MIIAVAARSRGAARSQFLIVIMMRAENARSAYSR
jgi:hypothetical protein